MRPPRGGPGADPKKEDRLVTFLLSGFGRGVKPVKRFNEKTNGRDGWRRRMAAVNGHADTGTPLETSGAHPDPEQHSLPSGGRR